MRCSASAIESLSADTVELMPCDSDVNSRVSCTVTRSCRLPPVILASDSFVSSMWLTTPRRSSTVATAAIPAIRSTASRVIASIVPKRPAYTMSEVRVITTYPAS